MGYHYKYFRPTQTSLQSGDRFYTSESDVYRRQILTFKVDPRSGRVKVIFRIEYRFSDDRRSAGTMGTMGTMGTGIICIHVCNL